MLAQASILVVDADEAARELVASSLEGAGYSTIAVTSPAEALASIERGAPSAIVLDWAHDEAEGRELLQMLRSRTGIESVPVLVLTSLDSDDVVSRALDAGADDFVRKPFRGAELVSRIRGQLRMRQYVETIARRERTAQLVLEMTQALSSSLDIREILFTLVRRLAEVTNVDRVSIVLVREHGDVGYVIAASDDEHVRDLRLELTKYPEIREALSSGHPVVIPDATTHPLLEVVRETLPADAFTSLTLLPILFERRPMGVLFLRSRHRTAFGQAELALFRTIANTTAMALRNARILQTLRDESQQSTVLRHEAERRLRALERYADFFESAADGICVIDTEGQLLFANRRAREITGFIEGELVGKRLSHLLSEKDRLRAHEIRQGFSRGIFPQGVDLRFRRKDGRPIVISINFSSVLREERAILFTFRDVTQEREMEAELRKTKDFLERVIDSSVDAIVSADRRGNVIVFNRAAERCYGYRAEEVIGKLNVTSLYPEGMAREIMRRIREAGAGPHQGIEDFRCELLAKDGERIPVSISASLIHDRGEPVGTVGIFTDLREQLRMQERLTAAQEELKARERQAIVAELAGAAAHELNQPLTSVAGYAELLKRKLDRDTSAFSAVEIIASETERMAEIVRKIGKITKYETKSYVGRAKILDLEKASADSSKAWKDE